MNALSGFNGPAMNSPRMSFMTIDGNIKMFTILTTATTYVDKPRSIRSFEQQQSSVYSHTFALFAGTQRRAAVWISDNLRLGPTLRRLDP